MMKSASLKSFAIGGLIAAILVAIALSPLYEDGIIPVSALILPLGVVVLVDFGIHLVRAIRSGSNDAHRQAFKFWLMTAIWLCGVVSTGAGSLALVMIDPWDHPNEPIDIAKLIPIYLWAIVPIVLILIPTWIYWRWTLKRGT